MDKAGVAREFSLRCGINAANISRYLRGVIRCIKDDNWEKLAPYLDSEKTENANYSINTDIVRSTPELTEFITSRMKMLRIRNIEQLRQQMNFSNYESLRRQMSGKLNWFADTIARVFETLEIDSADAPVTANEKRLIDHAAMKRHGTGVMRMIPVIMGLENGTPSIDGEIAVPLKDERDLRAFRINGEQMKPVLSPGDIGIFEVLSPGEQLSTGQIAVIRYHDSISEKERLVFRRFCRASGGLAVLNCDNPEFPCIVINENNISWCAILKERISRF